MRAIVQFAGAGGSTLGLERAGIETLGVEWWDVAAETHRAAGMPCVTADVRDWSAWMPNLGAWGVWSSPPCQDWSSAGSRAGGAGGRNGWPWALGSVREMRRRGVVVPWFIAENVPGMTHHLQRAHPDALRCPGCYLDRVRAAVGRMWPHSGMWLIDAADLGVPQHRHRIFVWGADRPLMPPAPTHYPTGGLLTPWWRGAGEVVDGADGGLAYPSGPAFGPSASKPGAPSMTIRAGGKGHSAPVLYTIAGQGRTGMGAPRTIDQPAPTVSGVGNAWLEPCPTVTATENRGCATDARRASRAFGRRLTAAECAALQAFPDDYPWQGTQTDRYKQAGNAVPPPVAEAIGRRIREAFGVPALRVVA